MHLIEEPSPSARAHHDQSSSCNILIVGAGLAGVATAIALTRASQAVVVLEAHEQFTEVNQWCARRQVALFLIWASYSLVRAFRYHPMLRTSSGDGAC